MCTPLWWNRAGTSNRQENEEARLAAILVLQIGKIDVRIRGFDWTILQDFRLDVEAEDLLKWQQTSHEGDKLLNFIGDPLARGAGA